MSEACPLPRVAVGWDMVPGQFPGRPLTLVGGGGWGLSPLPSRRRCGSEVLSGFLGGLAFTWGPSGGAAAASPLPARVSRPQGGERVRVSPQLLWAPGFTRLWCPHQREGKDTHVPTRRAGVTFGVSTKHPGDPCCPARLIWLIRRDRSSRNQPGRGVAGGGGGGRGVSGSLGAI